MAVTLHGTPQMQRCRSPHQHVAHAVEAARPQICPLQAEVAAVGVPQALRPTRISARAVRCLLWPRRTCTPHPQHKLSCSRHSGYHGR